MNKLNTASQFVFLNKISLKTQFFLFVTVNKLINKKLIPLTFFK